MRCDDAHLKDLLTGDEDSAKYRSLVAHLDSCPRCQRRLTELSCDEELLKDVRDTFHEMTETRQYSSMAFSSCSSIAVSVERQLSEESGVECEPISLDFLAAASHPEMLGRIGRYEVERLIGAGGMGIVLKGFDTELHRVVAIKVLKPDLAHNGAARRRFSREAQSAAAVVHPHVIPIHDVQPEGDTPFLVMQYVPGQSLQTRVDERGPLESREILRISAQAAAGLSAAHAQGVVHRDVKPANILLEESVERVLISDFGLARTVDDATLTRTGVVAGTPHYMSPEQASGHPVDHRSDLFSLGAVIYFMCTGRPPFRADHALAVLNRICNDTHRPVDEINADVPPELADVVDRLLAKNPGDRFHDAHAVQLQLEGILLQIQNGRNAHRLRWKRLWRRWLPAVRKSLFAAAVISLCLVVGAGLMWWQLKSRDNASSSRNSDVVTSLPSYLSPSLPETSSAVAQPGIKKARTAPRNALFRDLSELVSQLPPDAYPKDAATLEEHLTGLEFGWRHDNDRGKSSITSDAWKENLDQVKGLLNLIGTGALEEPVPDVVED